MTENMSYTGVLFWGELFLKASTPVEMQLEMPVGVDGEIGAEVVCRGEIVRSMPPASGEARARLIARILEYRIVQDEERSAA